MGNVGDGGWTVCKALRGREKGGEKGGRAPRELFGAGWGQPCLVYSFGYVDMVDR